MELAFERRRLAAEEMEGREEGGELSRLWIEARALMWVAAWEETEA